MENIRKETEVTKSPDIICFGNTIEELMNEIMKGHIFTLKAVWDRVRCYLKILTLMHVPTNASG